MKEIDSPYSKIRLLEANIFEITTHEGVAYSRKILMYEYDTMHKLNDGNSFAILACRINHYSFEADGLVAVGDHPAVKGIAVWIDDYKQWEIAKIHTDYPRTSNTPLEIFHIRSKAMDWLKMLL